MRIQTSSFLNFALLSACFGIMACTSQLGQEAVSEPIDGDIIESTGLCEKDSVIEPCPISKIPKYFRQLVVFDGELSYGERPNTINSFTILRHIGNGYLIDGKIGFKYVKGKGNPGHVEIAGQPSDLETSVTVYEIFSDDLNIRGDEVLGLGKLQDSAVFSPTCRVERYSRKGESVVVIFQEKRPSKERGLNCSAKGHLYYFGVQNISSKDLEGFYTLGKRTPIEVKFDKEKIIGHLQRVSD